MPRVPVMDAGLIFRLNCGEDRGLTLGKMLGNWQTVSAWKPPPRLKTGLGGTTA
jgi:hypothetical protein